MKLVITEYPYVDSSDLFAKVANQHWAVFLDSGNTDQAQSPSDHANYDVLAIKPQSTLVFDGNHTKINSGSTQETKSGDPLTILQEAIPNVDLQTANDLDCAYTPGALGYFSYDLARQFEDLPNIAEDTESLPPMAMGIYFVVVVIDHKKRKTCIVQLGCSSETQSIINEWRGLISLTEIEQQALNHEPEESLTGLLANGLEQNMTPEMYQMRFNRIREYTIEGDCYQVNLTKQFSTSVKGDSWITYRSLRMASPAPYGAFMNFPFAKVLSNSPESFIQCRQANVTTSPIKGTYPRDHSNPDMDKQNSLWLFNSTKDRAENVMIVDLMRNDLSRCCELGSVKVPKLFEVHSFANVHHLISTVTGTLLKGLHALDLIRHCFPGGSITGAPKIRAMQIIEELEPNRRGLYCGSIAYIGVDGNLETNIAIRTIVIKDDIARYSAGGGLVIDSDVDSEHQELTDKSRMLTEALFHR